MPDCYTMEKLIHRYSECYGIDPAITEKKDILDLYIFVMIQNEQAWIMYDRTPKK